MRDRHLSAHMHPPTHSANIEHAMNRAPQRRDRWLTAPFDSTNAHKREKLLCPPACLHCTTNIQFRNIFHDPISKICTRSANARTRYRQVDANRRVKRQMQATKYRVVTAQPRVSPAFQTHNDRAHSLRQTGGSTPVEQWLQKKAACNKTRKASLTLPSARSPPHRTAPRARRVQLS